MPLMQAAWRQLALGVLLGFAATAAWFGFHWTYLSWTLFVISIGFVSHAACITPSGEHGETCATPVGESSSRRAPERPLISYVVTALIGVAVVLLAQRGWDLIKNYVPSVAEALASQWFKEGALRVAAFAMGLLWIRRVVTAARMLRERALSQQS